jgi:protein-S-isoprenylcysteine O-methyltransferase Ste14
MRPAFAGQPLAAAVFGFTLVMWVAIETVQAFRRRASATNSDRNSLLFLRVCIVGGVLLSQLAPRVTATAFLVNPVILSIAFVLMWAGIGLRWWCFRTLGRYFTFTVMTSSDQPVMTTGPYRLLRHPSYTGIFLVLLGIGLTFGNWLSLAAIIVLPSIGFLYRIRVEESALSAALGDAYTSYARGRKRIVPFIW